MIPFKKPDAANVYVAMGSEAARRALADAGQHGRHRGGSAQLRDVSVNPYRRLSPAKDRAPEEHPVAQCPRGPEGEWGEGKPPLLIPRTGRQCGCARRHIKNDVQPGAQTFEDSGVTDRNASISCGIQTHVQTELRYASDTARSRFYLMVTEGRARSARKLSAFVFDSKASNVSRTLPIGRCQQTSAASASVE
jgi:hypothetical protein